MHFRTLVTVDIPPVVEDEKENQAVVEAIAGLKSEKKPDKKNILIDFFLSTLYGKVTSFARAVTQSVADIMEPYSADPPDEYLEFDDRTDMLRSEYEQSVDCLKLPEGKVVELCSYPYYGRFCIIDGKIYQKNAGPLHHEKRTKKAKRIMALPNYPRTKVYKSFKAYAEDYRGYTFDEKHEAYGFYCNPNAMWDWYQIGGRWPDMFLVKSDCKEQSPGERSWCNEDAELKAPEGYIWVAAARKKDICWDVMREWITQRTTERFQRLEKMFAAGKTEDGFEGHIVDDGIISWGEYAYRKDETLEAYLERCAIPKAWKYPFSVHDIVDADCWLSKDDSYLDSESGKYLPVEWRSQIDEYVDDLDDETVLVGVDYHM